MIPRVALAATIVVALTVAALAYEPTAPTEARRPLIGATVQVVEFRSTIANPACGDVGCGKLVTEALMESLRLRGMAAAGVGAPASPAAVVEGEIVTLDEGNRASRYFYGGGASRVALRGRVLDGYGRVIGAFDDVRENTSGKFGGNSDDLLKVTVREVAEAVADRIATGQY